MRKLETLGRRHGKTEKITWETVGIKREIGSKSSIYRAQLCVNLVNI